MTQATDPRYRSSRLFGRLWRGYLKPHAGLMVLAFLFLMADGATLGLLSAVLEPLYRKHSEWRPLIDLLELSLSSAADPSERRRILAQIAGLQEAGLSDATSAFATWGRILSEDGSDEEAMRELLEYCFIQLHTERVTLDHLPQNERAAALYLKLGFQYEGVMRHAGKKNGKYIDLHLMSMLRSEFFEKCRNQL